MIENTCPTCGQPVQVWADNSDDAVTVNFACDNQACKAGKAPWDTPRPAPAPDNSPEAVEARKAMFRGFGWGTS